MNSPLGKVKDGLELELTLDGEVLDCEVVLPVVGERLVEGRVLFLRDVGGVASPDGLSLVELLVGSLGLLDLLRLLVLGLALLVLVNFLDLGLLGVLLDSLIILDLLGTRSASVAQR